MKPGDFYDTGYMSSFLYKYTGKQGRFGGSAKWRAVADPDSHMVDLTITFSVDDNTIEVH